MSRAGEGGVAVGGAAAAAGEVGVAVMTIIPRADLSEALARSLYSVNPLLQCECPHDSQPPPLISSTSSFASKNRTDRAICTSVHSARWARFSHVFCFQSRCVPRIPFEEVKAGFMKMIQSAFAEYAREIAATDVADDQPALQIGIDL